MSETVEDVPLPTRDRQRSDTRNRILRVALAEIAEVGLAQTRIEHIARKAGVTRPTIYAHFPTKEDFLRELQGRKEKAALHALQERIGDAGGAKLIHRLTDAVFDLVEAAPPVLHRETFALMVREPQEMDWTGNPLMGFVSKRIEEAQARGELRANRTPAELTKLTVTALFGFLVLANDPPGAPRRAAHRMLDLLIGGAAGGPTANTR